MPGLQGHYQAAQRWQDGFIHLEEESICGVAHPAAAQLLHARQQMLAQLIHIRRPALKAEGSIFESGVVQGDAGH